MVFLKGYKLCFSSREMECDKVEVINGVEDRVPVPGTFWQKVGPRCVAGIALFGPAAAVFVSQYWSARHEVVHAKGDTPPVTGYAIEVSNDASEPAPAATAPITVDVIANPPRSVSDRSGGLQLVTKPTNARYAIYAGIIADKTLPASAPLRSGTSPGTVDNLRSGNYTIFFRKEGWPDSRTEIQVQSGEVLPLAYAFPHGEVTITSDPNGAEILLGTASLGFTPLKVDLPPGQQQLTARLKNYPDRKQTITVNDNSRPTIDFQMQIHRHAARVRATPTPSVMDRVGSSLKRLFGGNSTPPPRRKR